MATSATSSAWRARSSVSLGDGSPPGTSLRSTPRRRRARLIASVTGASSGLSARRSAALAVSPFASARAARAMGARTSDAAMRAP